jgi:glycosyltransferase involved in cell wall biosynthesis
MRTQGERPGNLEEALTCLAAQAVDDFEVHLAVHHDDPEVVRQVQDLVARFADGFQKRVDVFPVAGGGRARPLNAGLERAGGRYVAFLDDDDLVTGDWVEAFRAGSEEAPGSVVRCSSVNQRIERAGPSARAPYVEVGEPETVFAARFDLLEHLQDNSTPIFSFAVPRTVVGEARFCEDLPVLEDWEFLLRMALAAGVHDTGRVTGVYHWWVSGESTLDQAGAAQWQEARRQVLSRIDRHPVLLPAGSAGRLAVLLDDLAAIRAELATSRAEADTARRNVEAVLGSRYWRGTAPLRWFTSALRRRRPRP